MKGGKKWKWLSEGLASSGAKEKVEAIAMGASSMASTELQSSPRDQRKNGGGVSEVVRESQSESVSSSRDTWSTEKAGERPMKRLKQEGQAEMKMKEMAGGGEKNNGHNSPKRIKLLDVAREPIQAIAKRMREEVSTEGVEDLKGELRDILAGAGGDHQREEFAMLQGLVLGRSDLSLEALELAHQAQLKILVAIKTGIQAFLHEEICVARSVLIEVFFYKRCRNMACQSPLPGGECQCGICSTKSGFCNSCMCAICSKFDFDVNTCRWIGCDSCSHWTHTDCAIRVGQISMGVVAGKAAEMLFCCGACKHPSELLGWVKEVFRNCAADWGKEELMREFDSVRRIFHGSKDARGKKLFWKSEELLEKLRVGADCGEVRKDMQSFFQELEAEDTKAIEETKTTGPEETCNQIAEIVEEAIARMEAMATEKPHAYKMALLALETCEKELEEKRKDLAGIEAERQKNKQQLQELEESVRLKQLEADMFQMRANEARKEAEALHRRLSANKPETDDEHKSRSLKLRIDEAEAERRYLFEKVQIQEHSRLHPDPAQMLMMCEIQDLLKRNAAIKDWSRTESSRSLS